MEPKILISSNYGFDHNWTLLIRTDNGIKSFYLGQDVKFVNRVMGMDVQYLINEIGTRDISEGSEGNGILANYICNHLGIDGENVNELNSWDLCCQ